MFFGWLFFFVVAVWIVWVFFVFCFFLPLKIIIIINVIPKIKILLLKPHTSKEGNEKGIT